MTTGNRVRGAAVPLFLLASLLLGGSTRSIWPNLILQLGSIAILAWAALVPARMQSGVPGRRLGWLMTAMALIVLLQLIPMPPAVWSILPGRADVARGFGLLGQPLPWLPLSLTPYDTMTSALWLLVPFAVIAGIVRLGAYRAQYLAAIVGLAAFASIALGALQTSSGDQSPWYLYPITNNGHATGFFANSNHMGTLLFAAIPFMVALLGRRTGRPLGMHNRVGRIAVLGAVMILLILALAFNGSLAAIGLGVPVVVASLMLRAPLSGRGARWGLSGVAVIGAAMVIGIFAGPLPNNLHGSGADHGYASRQTSFANSLQAVAKTFPVGTGSGSFPAVYPAFENPDIVDAWFVNHVHNDYIELMLETGLSGMVLIAGFGLWWAGRAVAIWRAPEIDQFARAATIASGAILAHSLVDFPLRTSAIAALFATCVALMAGPRRRTKVAPNAPAPRDGALHLSID